MSDNYEPEIVPELQLDGSTFTIGEGDFEKHMPENLTTDVIRESIDYINTYTGSVGYAMVDMVNNADYDTGTATLAPTELLEGVEIAGTLDEEGDLLLSIEYETNGAIAAAIEHARSQATE